MRTGALPARNRNLVYFPTSPALRDVDTHPDAGQQQPLEAPNADGDRRSRPAPLGTARTCFLKGQLRPVQRTVIFVRTGAFTRSSRTRVPRPVIRPVIRTTGNGLNSRSSDFCVVTGAPGTGATVSVCESKETSPALSVTRSPTT